MDKITVLFLTGNDVPNMLKEDPYGSLWMETEEPVKTKKQRRSNLLVDFTVPPVVTEEGGLNVEIVNKGTVLNENGIESEYYISGTIEQNELSIQQDRTLEKVCNENCIHTKETARNFADTVSQSKKNIDKHLLTNVTHEGCKKGEHATVRTEKSESAANSIMFRQKTGDEVFDSENTPPDNIKLSTPQSMSPEFPMSPADMLYTGDHDNSYVSFLPTDRNTDRPDTEKKIDKSSSFPFNIIAEDNELKEKYTSVQVNKSVEANNSFDPSKLESSLTEREDTVLSLSDKENTGVDHENEGRQSASPGILSLCKAFAVKVVDLVKTSPSYLSNILQDSKANTFNSESPALKQDSPTKTVSPEDGEISDIKLALEPELSKSLQKMPQSQNQIIQVYSVTGITKDDDKCNHKENDDKEDQDNNVGKKAAEALSINTKTVINVAKRKKRKSVSKTFFDTFNAVSNELNKTTHANDPDADNRQADETDGFNEQPCISNTDSLEFQLANISVTQDRVLKSLSPVSDDLVCADTVGDELKNNYDHIQTEENVIDSSFKGPFARSSKTQNITKQRRDKSSDTKLLNEGHTASGEEKINKEVNVNNSRKRGKSIIEDPSDICYSFTEIKHMKKSEISDSDSQTVNNNSSSSSALSLQESSSYESFNAASVTDSTTSVLEGFSKLDLDMAIPQSDLSQEDLLKKKQDRRRRRSKSFYFPSLYSEAEDKQNENYNKTDSATDVSYEMHSKEVNEITSNSHSQDCQVNQVSKVISPVKINDRNNAKDSGENIVDRLPAIAEETEISVPILDVLKDKNETTKVGLDDFKNDNADIDIIEEPASQRKKRRSAGTALLQIELQTTDTNSGPLPEQSVEPSDLAPRRRRRRSADAAVLKIQMFATDASMSPVAEECTGPSSAPFKLNAGRKRKKLPEVPLEDIYRNKNYIKPPDKTWETIFESPKANDQLFSKRRVHTYFDFETFYKPPQDKLKKRVKRAVKNGWDPKKRKRQALPEDEFQMKISNVFSELDEDAEESISEKIKSTIGY